MLKSKFSRLQYTFLLNDVPQMSGGYYMPVDVGTAIADGRGLPDLRETW